MGTQIEHNLDSKRVLISKRFYSKFQPSVLHNSNQKATTSTPTTASEESQCTGGRDQKSKRAGFDFYVRNLITLKIKYNVSSSIR